MTSPAPSPGPAKRSKRLYVYWGVAFTLLAVTGAFCWFVIVPVLSAREAVDRVRDGRSWSQAARREVQLLGGPREAARSLGLYVRMPAFVAPDPAVAANMLSLCGSEATAALISLIKHEDIKVQRRAVWALGQVGDPRATGPLILSLTHTDKDMRWFAAEALGKICDPSSADALNSALEDESDRVRRSAAIALGNLGDRRASDPLMALLKDKPPIKWDRRHPVVRALTHIKDPRIPAILIPLLEDDNYAIRFEVAKALGILRAPEAIPPLMVRVLQDKNRGVRAEAAKSLGLIGHEKAILVLEPALKDKSEYVREAAAEALKRIRGKRRRRSGNDHRVPAT